MGHDPWTALRARAEAVREAIERRLGIASPGPLEEAPEGRGLFAIAAFAYAKELRRAPAEIASEAARTPVEAPFVGLTASGEATARNISSAAVWTGSAKIAEFSPQDLLQRFGLPPQPTSDPAAFRRATVDTRFDVTKDRAELAGLVLAIDETTITGRFALRARAIWSAAAAEISYVSL